MQWLNKIVDDTISRFPEGEILVESGGSPSGTYHLGHMRELVTCDAIVLGLRARGRQARHIYFVDDLDIFRKVPINVPANFEQYLGMPICDVPSPDGTEGRSYADFFLQGLVDSCRALNVEVEFVRSYPKYRSGWFVPAIELCLEHIPQIRQALETISSRQLDSRWTPIQILENGRLKNRAFLGIDKATKTLTFEDADGQPQVAHYDKGEVKLDWRLDWPARWWQLKVQVEPFGREHASAGGSYDTGVQIMKDVFKAAPPIPVPYDSIHMVGDTKKMSASKGTAVSAMEGTKIMPAEVIRYFILRAPLNKMLFFDPVDGVVKLMDEFAALVAKKDRAEVEEQLLYVSTRGLSHVTVSRVPFSHLVASYQASLKDANKTLGVIKRTEYAQVAEEDADTIREELRFIDEWLRLRAPEDVKFSLAEQVNAADFDESERAFLRALGEKVATAPVDADGVYFHNAIYELKEELGLSPKELFTILYRALIGKDSGPRAGWFLSILPRDWLVKRLKLEA
jgi:lysyl-tRNA synthetase, class I